MLIVGAIFCIGFAQLYVGYKAGKALASLESRADVTKTGATVSTK